MLEVGGSYNYIRARSDEDDPDLAMAPLDRQPAHRFDAWVQVSPDPRISLQARARYFGDSVDKKLPVPGYTVFETTLSAPITKEYIGVLRVEDVTDVRPETRKGFYAPGRVLSFVVQASWE
jgi:outer membrane receptor protein involved in Fe transport